MASTVKLRINGRKQDGQPLWLTAQGRTAELFAGIESTAIEISGSARGTEGGLLQEIPADALVEVELEGGLHFWTSAEDLRNRLSDPDGVDARGLDEDGSWALPASIDLPGAQRGFFGQLALKALRWLDIKPDDALRNTIVDKVQNRSIPKEGLYPVGADGALGTRLTTPIPDGAPSLVLLHGTGSSTAGSFSRLWTDQKEKWQALRAYYGDRIYALEHWTLTRSPIENALDAARLLPKKGNVSFLSHSRGGLVGELLCLDPGGFDLAGALATLDAQKSNSAPQNNAVDNQCKALGALVDELRGRPGLSIDRFVRAACPARGTSLAGDKLDQWGSLMVLAAIGLEMKSSDKRGFGGPLGTLLDIGLDTVSETVASVLASRRRPDELPGLQAMMPGSALVTLLNAAPARGELYVIAGDAEPVEGDRLAALRIWLADRFYQRDHDLVVDTRSMLDGARRGSTSDGPRCKVQFRSGSDVNHFRYFRNDDSATAAVAALVHAADADSLFKDYLGEWPLADGTGEHTRGLFGPHPLPDPTKDLRGTVILVPGLCGSQLFANQSEIWANLLALAGGGFRDKLDIKAPIKAGDPLADTYLPLANSLRQRGYKVVMYGYDWRKPLSNSIGGLAASIDAAMTAMKTDRKPVHIVVHSMGGVLLRATFAANKKLWDDWNSHPGDPRTLMLGTPNQGSHAITLLLTGRDTFFRQLSLLDLCHSQAELLKTAGQFPGVMELLPWAESGDDQHIRDAATWHAFRDADANANWPLPPADVLAGSASIWTSLKQTDPLIASPRLIYVAGLAEQTPDKAIVDTQGRFQIIATPEGDGRVPWSTGIPTSCRSGGRVYYVRTAHGDLPKATDAHDGYLDLLERGHSDKLASQPPVVARGAAAARPWRTEETAGALYPTRGELLAAATGGTLRSARKAVRGSYRTEVRVLHGDLMYAESALLVGHTWGANALEQAEKLLDQALGGRMQKMLDAGLHAGALGTYSIYRRHPGEAFTRGAIVIGIGRIGQLSAGQLTQSVAKAVATFAVEEWEAEGLKALAERQSPLRVGISALLIGAGIGELSLADSVAAILRGHRDARQRLERAGLGGTLRLDRLDFIEVLEDRAINALRAARDAVDVDLALARSFFVDGAIRPHRGGRRRASSATDEGNWQRIAISTVGSSDDGAPRLMFDVYGELARAERTYNAVPFKDIERFTQSLIGTTADQEQVGRALFELLVPNWLKDLAPDRRRVQLVLDKTAAAYPWELLRDRATEHDGDSGQPLSVRSGLIRQLSTGQFRLNVRRTTDFKALVVGNPDLGEWARFLRPLDGAEKEARAVTDLLDNAGIVPTLHIQDEAKQILLDLFSGEWRMLHLSGHGVYRQDIPPTENLPAVKQATGMVIGGGDLLTPAHIEQMRAVPDFVFINCCSLGRIEEQPAGTPLPATSRPGSPGLAANLATQLIEIGVRCVIAAGWEVLDDAAELFATAFYDHFLSGINFGESVLAARSATFDSHGSSNTWGAYQCYGDPGFVLNSPARSARPDSPTVDYSHYLAASEALYELERLTLRANHARVLDKDADRTADKHAKALIALCERQGWIKQGAVLEAFGRLKGEYNFHEDAIDFYRRALAAPDASASRKAEEQLANMLTRRAKVISDGGDTVAALALLDEASTILAADRPPINAERLNLQGAVEKRRLACHARAGTLVDHPKILESMWKYYEKAAVLAGIEEGDIAYPALNAANACALMGLTGRFPKGEPKATLARLQSLRQGDAPQSKDFWGLSTPGNLLLAEGLLDLTTGKADSTLLDQARQAYVALMNTHVSPRERESVTSTVAILLQVLQKLDAAKGQEQTKASAEAALAAILTALAG